jgi:hypothetical protein
MSEKAREVKEEPAAPITMAIIDGMLILGTLIGGNKLLLPRLFNFINDGKEIQMGPLPGIPEWLRLGTGVTTYSISEQSRGIIELYKKVTTPQPESKEEPRIVLQ